MMTNSRIVSVTHITAATGPSPRTIRRRIAATPGLVIVRVGRKIYVTLDSLRREWGDPIADEVERVVGGSPSPTGSGSTSKRKNLRR